MKTTISSSTQIRSERGGVLVTTIIFCGLIGVMLIAYLSMLKDQHKFTHRSQVWNDCMAMCEAGIEEAMAHVNYEGTGNNFGVNGWAPSGAFFFKQRNFNSGHIRVSISNGVPPIIIAEGYLRAPVQTNYIQRTVLVSTMFNVKFPYPMLSKGPIDVNSAGGRIDSFNSTNALESTGGKYDPAKANDNANLATLAQTKGAISMGSLSLYGKAGTGPGGTVTLGGIGNVGSETWNNDPTYNGQVEPGYFADDVNVYIPDQTLPSPFGFNLPVIGGGTNSFILTGGDYRMPSLSVQPNRAMLVTGKARLYVSGNTFVGGAIILAPGASLEFYSGGDIDIKGVVNNQGVAANLSIVGLNSCQSISVNGNAEFIGTINAPYADVVFTGGSSASGAIVAETIKMSGGMSFHYDEALNTPPKAGKFILAAWQELGATEAAAFGASPERQATAKGKRATLPALQSKVAAAIRKWLRFYSWLQRPSLTGLASGSPLPSRN